MISNSVKISRNLAACSRLLTNSLINSGRSFYTYTNEPAHAIPGRKPPVLSAEQALSVVKSSKFDVRSVIQLSVF